MTAPITDVMHAVVFGTNTHFVHDSPYAYCQIDCYHRYASLRFIPADGNIIVT